MSATLAGESGMPSARVQRLRARRRAVRIVDVASFALVATWAMALASGAFPPALDVPPRSSGWFTALGGMLVIVLAIRRRLDPVTPLREIPLVMRAAELAGSRWLASRRLVPCAFVVTALLVAGGAIAWYRAFAGSVALGLFENVLWNSVHGRVGLSGFLGDRSLAAGFAPLLLVLAGPYAILERAETLLVIQSLAVAACAFPLARLARRELTNPSLAHALVLAQAAYLPMRVAARCDFQPALLAAPLLLECFVSFREGRIRRGAWAWGGALACGPLVVPAACSLGIYVALVLRRGRLGVMLVCLSLGWLAALTLLAGSAEPSNPWFVGLAPSAPMIILVALAPLAFLPLLAPTHAMLALPSVVLAAMYASTGRGGTDGGHLAVAAPMLLVAATFGARKLIERDDLRTLLAFYPTVAELERYVAGLLLLGAVVFIGWSPVAELRLASGRASIDRRQVLAGVPEDALVSAQANLAAHLARRAHVAVFPDRLAPWIVLDGGRWSGSSLGRAARERWEARLRESPGCVVDAARGPVVRFHCGAAALQALETLHGGR